MNAVKSLFRRRPRLAISHPLQARRLMAAMFLSVLLPGAMFAGAALESKRYVERDAELAARRTVTALVEQAARVFDSHELILRQIQVLAGDRPWSEVAADHRLVEYLGEVTRRMDQVGSVQLIDADGRLRYGTGQGTPSGEWRGDREYFDAHRRNAVGDAVYVSAPYVSKTTGERMFNLSLRRNRPDGTFDGIFVVAVEIAYFENFWKQLAPAQRYTVPLMRADGLVIVRFPAEQDMGRRMPPTAPFMQAVKQSPSGVYKAVSHIDGIERLNAYSQIPGLPLFLSFSTETAEIYAPWRAQMAAYGTVTVGVTGILLYVCLLVRRRVRHQEHEALRLAQVARDLQAEIDKRRLAEAKLVHAQKMEAVGQLTGGIAHDFNNMLHSVVMNVYLLKRGCAGNPAQVELLAGIQRAVDSATKLTRQLLAFSRRQTLEPRAIDLEEFLPNIGDLVTRTVGSRVTVRIELAPGTRAPLADYHQAEIALLNLAINARDAMPDGGTLTLTASSTSLATAHGELRAGEYTVLAMTDTGTGMPADVLAQAFEPFFTTKEVGKGSGLGLSQVYGFATQSGGGVTLDSTPGRGTTVSIYLPVARTAAPAPDEEPGPLVVTAPGSVLLVDDDADVLATTCTALEDKGFRVLAADNGVEALRILATTTVDVLVTDWAMPAMNGAELVERARALRSALPVLMITGYPLQRGGAAGAQALEVPATVERVLQKPVSIDAMAEAIQALMVQRDRSAIA